MNRACIILTTCLFAVRLPAQSAGGPMAPTSWPAASWYPPYYSYYGPYHDDLAGLKNFYNYWTSVDQSGPPKPMISGTTPPPPPPATPLVREYHWPEEDGQPASFSIVTASGVVYLATMVWVEGGNVHFNALDGGVLVIPLSSISKSLTQTANAQKNLNLPLPWTQAVTPTIEAATRDQPPSAQPPSSAKAK